MHHRTWLGLSLLAAASLHAAPPPDGTLRVETSLSLQSVEGDLLHPLACATATQRAAVLLFITTDCPIANRYAPEIEKIRADYEPKGVKLTLVHVDPDLTTNAARQHAAEFGLTAPLVIDREHVLVSATGAQVTPEAVVIDPSGSIRYRGRINDQFAELGKRRSQPSSHDLREALNAVLENRPVTTPFTKAIGCQIPTRP